MSPSRSLLPSTHTEERGTRTEEPGEGPETLPVPQFPQLEGDQLCFGSTGSPPLLGATTPMEVASSFPQEKLLETPISLRKGHHPRKKSQKKLPWCEEKHPELRMDVNKWGEPREERIEPLWDQPSLARGNTKRWGRGGGARGIF